MINRVVSLNPVNSLNLSERRPRRSYCREGLGKSINTLSGMQKETADTSYTKSHTSYNIRATANKHHLSLVQQGNPDLLCGGVSVRCCYSFWLRISICSCWSRALRLALSRSSAAVRLRCSQASKAVSCSFFASSLAWAALICRPSKCAGGACLVRPCAMCLGCLAV